MDLHRQRTGPGTARALLYCLAAVACSRPPPAPPRPPPAAATVNGVAIPLSRLQLELDRVRRPMEGGPAPVAQDPQALARAVLDTLVDRAVVGQRAKAAGMQVSEAEVQRATDAFAEEVRRGGQPFVERLKTDGQTMETLSDETRERLLAERYVAEQTLKERASSAEARAWFDQHRAQFDTPEEVHAQQIVVRTADEAKSLLDQLRAGAPFARLAAAHSTSPDARQGGDLGWFPRGTMPKQFDDACFALAPGKLSGVVASPYGFHIFKLLGRRAPRHPSFSEVRQEAERLATAEKRMTAERQLLAQLRAAAEIKIEPSSFALLR